MSTKNPVRFAKRLRREHKLTREKVDALPWPHPRPSSDPRLVYVHLALIWVAAGQSVLGPPENTLTARSFGWAATIVFGALLILCCLLYLAAAYCKSQYESFGYEMAACVGFAGTLGIYAFILVMNTPNWAITYNAAFTIALALGNARRGWTLIRRLW